MVDFVDLEESIGIVLSFCFALFAGLLGVLLEFDWTCLRVGFDIRPRRLRFGVLVSPGFRETCVYPDWPIVYYLCKVLNPRYHRALPRSYTRYC